jgi:hypothetical protein
MADGQRTGASSAIDRREQMKTTWNDNSCQTMNTNLQKAPERISGRWLLLLAIGVGLAVPQFQAQAADHLNLEENLPVRVEDAYPIAFRGREIQSYFRYDRTRDDKDRFALVPQLELGIAPNTEFQIAAPFYVGNADRTGSGDIELSLLYNFNTEGIWLPALAAEVEGVVPTGKRTRGFDTTLKFIATKSVTRTGQDRVHLNAAWARNAGAWHDEREHRYFVILGYSRPFAPDWLFVADFVREQERERGSNSNIFELGARWQVTPLTVISMGVGAGIGEESPRARAVIGFQKSF